MIDDKEKEALKKMFDDISEFNTFEVHKYVEKVSERCDGGFQVTVVHLICFMEILVSTLVSIPLQDNVPKGIKIEIAGEIDTALHQLREMIKEAERRNNRNMH